MSQSLSYFLHRFISKINLMFLMLYEQTTNISIQLFRYPHESNPKISQLCFRTILWLRNMFMLLYFGVVLI